MTVCGVVKGMTSITIGAAVGPHTGGLVGIRGRDRTAEAAVRSVYDAHYGRLVGWATKLVDDRDLAHDMVTEAFIKLLKHWGKVDEPKPWLYTTVGNLARDHWRKRSREDRAYRTMEAGQPDEPVHDVDPATRLTVRGAIESLPERLRMCVLLHYFADLTVAQVAEQLGKAPGTVKSDLYEARGKLANVLGGVR